MKSFKDIIIDSFNFKEVSEILNKHSKLKSDKINDIDTGKIIHSFMNNLTDKTYENYQLSLRILSNASTQTGNITNNLDNSELINEFFLNNSTNEEKSKFLILLTQDIYTNCFKNKDLDETNFNILEELKKRGMNEDICFNIKQNLIDNYDCNIDDIFMEVSLNNDKTFNCLDKNGLSEISVYSFGNNIVINNNKENSKSTFSSSSKKEIINHIKNELVNKKLILNPLDKKDIFNNMNLKNKLISEVVEDIVNKHYTKHREQNFDDFNIKDKIYLKDKISEKLCSEFNGDISKDMDIRMARNLPLYMKDNIVNKVFENTLDKLTEKLKNEILLSDQFIQNFKKSLKEYNNISIIPKVGQISKSINYGIKDINLSQIFVDKLNLDEDKTNLIKNQIKHIHDMNNKYKWSESNLNDEEKQIKLSSKAENLILKVLNNELENEEKQTLVEIVNKLWKIIPEEAKQNFCNSFSNINNGTYTELTKNNISDDLINQLIINQGKNNGREKQPIKNKNNSNKQHEIE